MGVAQEYAGAQNNLGTCYYNGVGVSKDYSEAVKWFRKAAYQGDANAQNNYAICFEKGHGVTKDYSEAAKWFRKAAEQGHENAKKQLQKIQEMGY